MTADIKDDKTESRREYNRRYNQENKDRIAARRRERYESDPKYRRQCQERSKRWREKRKQERDAQPRPRGRNPETVIVGGEQVEAMTIGYVASRLGKNRGTIHHWIREGLLPATPFVTELGEALFTEAMIEAITAAVSRRPGRRVRKDDADFTREIVDAWRAHGVSV